MGNELQARFDADLKVAMKARDAARVSVLRMVKSALQMRRIDKGSDLDDTEVQAVLQTLVKQREDSVSQFRSGGREEMAAKEEAEIEVIRAYLPAEASDDEIAAAVDRAVGETGAATQKDLGRVMKAALGALKASGKLVDGRRVNEAARKRLAG